MIRRPLALALSASLVVAACAGSDDDETVADEAPADDDATEEPESEPESEPDDAAAEPAEEAPAEEEAVEEVVFAPTPASEGALGSEVEAEDASVVVQPARHAGLAARVEVTTEEPVVVSITATSGDHVVATPLTAAASTEHDLPLVGMRADRTYDIDVETFTEDGEPIGVVSGATFTTAPLPDWMLDHEITGEAGAASPGLTLIEIDNGELLPGMSSNQYLGVYDDEGEVVWWYGNTGSLGGVEQSVAGTLLMHYWPFGIREVDLLGNVVGHWRPQPSTVEEETVDDEVLVEGVDPEQVELFVNPLLGNEGDPDPLPVRADWVDLTSFHHENWPMPNGNVLALATTSHELTDEQRAAFCPDDDQPFNVLSDVVVEFEPDGRVVRTWDLWDAISVDDFPGLEMCTDEGLFAEEDLRDWTHANSVIYDPDRDAILISSRHTNQVVALDHLDDEGPQAQLRWILGDGATIPFEGDSIHFQHAVEVDEQGRIVLFDNGNFRPGTSPEDPENPPYSRAVIWEVNDSADDPAEWSAREVWSYRTEDPDGLPVFAPFISDADPLENGNVLVTFGGVGPTPFDPSVYFLIQEVTPDLEVVWQFRSEPGAEPDTAYRAERIPSLYAGPLWQT